jgi:hypothetical protein
VKKNPTPTGNQTTVSESAACHLLGQRTSTHFDEDLQRLLQLPVELWRKVSLLKGLHRSCHSFAALGKLQHNSAVTQGAVEAKKGRTEGEKGK